MGVLFALYISPPPSSYQCDVDIGILPYNIYILIIV